MATTKKNTVYPEGIRMFPPHAKSPEFKKASIFITINELVEFCKKNPEYLTEYEGKKQLKLELLEGKQGLYLSVDLYKPEAKMSDEISSL